MKIWISMSVALWIAAALPAVAQELRSMRLGAGTVASIEFQVAGLLGNIISNPPGASNCPDRSACGLPGLVVTVLRTGSGLASIEAIDDGSLDGAVVSADLLWRAATGRGEFYDRPATSLRHVATLYSETLLVLVRRDSAIKSVADLRGRKIAIVDPEGSERAPVRALLAAYKLDEPSVRIEPVALDRALSKLTVGEVAAVLVRSSDPVALLARVQSPIPIVALPLEEQVVAELTKAQPYFVATRLPGRTEPGRTEPGRTESGGLAVSIPVQWVVSADLDDAMVRASLSALLHGQNRPALMSGHPAVAQISRLHALVGAVLPIHPGAASYYNSVEPAR